MKIGPLDFILKLLVFHAHERFWLTPSMQSLSRRALSKMCMWKLIAVTMTVLTTLAVTGELTLAFKLGPSDFFVKLFLYSAHERIWESISMGRRPLPASDAKDKKKTKTT